MSLFLKKYQLALMLPVAFAMYYFVFKNSGTFWYMYSFSLLVLMSISMLLTKIYDEMATWKTVLYGLGFGIIIYGVITGGYELLKLTPINTKTSMANFQEKLSPQTIWHFLLLMFIIVPGEEIFWRGFVQQKIKKYISVQAAIIVTSLFFALAIGLSGFVLGMLAAFSASIVLGFLYEWKKSMPLLIIAHLMMIVLLFLVRPLSG